MGGRAAAKAAENSYEKFLHSKSYISLNFKLYYNANKSNILLNILIKLKILDV